MPTPPTYPCVYVEELPSGVRTIEGVPTSVTAFVGRTLRGPTDAPGEVRSFRDFEEAYGGLSSDCPLSYAVCQFFDNGGQRALIARIERQAVAATIALGGGFNLVAANRGSWGNSLRVRVEHAPAQTGEAPDSRFHLHVKDTSTAQIESFVALSTEPEHPRYAARRLADNSALVRLVDPDTTPFSRPAAHGSAAGVGLDPLDDPASSASFGQDGRDGEPITDADIANPLHEAAQRGLWLLDQSDTVNLICIPPLAPGVDVAPSTWNTAIRYAAARRAFVIVDPPASWTSAADATAAVDQFVTRDSHAALYFPRILAPDPLAGNQPRPFTPCGAIAGLYARTDLQRGVWKAPAGTVATLTGVTGLTCSLTDADSDFLNPLAINALRSLPGRGIVARGARTLAGAEGLRSDYQYVPVRRLALFIEASLDRGLQWVALEPNGEPLWAAVRASVAWFLDQLWRDGAFQGSTPREAYVVKCDRETTTQSDITLGVLNVLVGFAPLKPAEFMDLHIALRTAVA